MMLSFHATTRKLIKVGIRGEIEENFTCWRDVERLHTECEEGREKCMHKTDKMRDIFNTELIESFYPQLSSF